MSASNINGYPNLIFDTVRNLFLFQLVNIRGGDSNEWCRCQCWNWDAAGAYTISGASFARANVKPSKKKNAGDGVRVVAPVNNQIARSLLIL